MSALLRLVGTALAGCLGWLANPSPTFATDFLVTMARPHELYVFDAKRREAVQHCSLPGRMNPGVLAVAPPNPGQRGFARDIVFVLTDRWENVYGVRLGDCKTVFSALQSTPQERVKTIASLAVSKDGAYVYTVQNPTRLLPGRYEVHPPRFAEFAVADGLNAKPRRTWPAPRQVTVLATGYNGRLYAAGRDVYELDPATGKLETRLQLASWQRPLQSRPDMLSLWPVDSRNDEMLLVYTTGRYASARKARFERFEWGYSSIDLKTGAAAQIEFASFGGMIFSAVRSPRQPELLFGVYHVLSKYSLRERKLLATARLPHSYYSINVSTDGEEIYVGGTSNDIGVYAAETLAHRATIRIPSGGDMADASLLLLER